MTDVSDHVTRTYRYRLYPTKRQIVALEEQLAFACDLYNAALEQRIWAYRTWGASVGRGEQQHQLTELRREPDRPDANYVSQEMVLQRLQHAFDAFFRRLAQGEKPGFPRFRAKARFNTLSWREKGSGYTVGERLRIQGVGHIKVRWHRELQGEVRQVRITRRNGRWWVAFMVRMDKPTPLPNAGREIGIDMGVREFASLSDGTRIVGPRARRRGAPAVRRAQRKVARRERGSHRRRKAVQLLGRQREREANRRRDAAHKATARLVNDFDLIAHEQLQTSAMVRGNRGLGREIHDQGWYQFFTLLAYKAENAGRQVIAVDPRYTSQTCAECGSVDARNRKAVHFLCLSCGHSDDADVNAARNILTKARTGPSGANADDVSRRLPEKQDA